MSNYGMKVSKRGKNVFTAPSKDLAFSSKFDTFKVLFSGELSLDLPAETVTSASVDHEVEFNHNLGYVPFYLPLAKGIVYLDALSSGGDYNINDSNELDIPAGGYSPGTSGEAARVYATSNKIVLKVTRFELFGFGQSFGARTVNVFYTLFHNRVDEEISLL